MDRQRACVALLDGKYKTEREPITITEPSQGKWKDGFVSYKLTNNTGDIPGEKLEARSLNLAFLEWARYIQKIKFKRVYGSSPADIVVKFDSTDPYFAGSDGILAYTWYPNVSSNLAGDMVVNDSPTLRWSLTGAPIKAHDADPEHYPDPNDTRTFKTVSIRQVFTHELGHALGLPHNTACLDCIMYPYYHRAVYLASNDIERAQAIYGKRAINASILESLRKIIGRPLVE